MTEENTQSSKHTPGPWSATMQTNSFGPNGRFSICRDTDDAERTLICEMPHSSTTGLSSLKTRAANADLIAAAPEMLEALKRLVDAVENLEGVNAQCEPHPKSVMHQALAAIAKAENS